MPPATGPEVVRALAIRSGLEFYRKHRMKVNRLYTPKNMLHVAEQITGKVFKRGQYAQAINALTEWLREQGALA